MRRHSAMAPPSGGGEEASLKEQKEAGLEHGEAEQDATLTPLPLGGGEDAARPALTNPMPAAAAAAAALADIGSRVGRLRKRDWRRPPPWPPAPPSSIWWLALSRAERDI